MKSMPSVAYDADAMPPLRSARTVAIAVDWMTVSAPIAAITSCAQSNWHQIDMVPASSTMPACAEMPA